eukprot:TRINITY_DN2541_c0_g1_i1.p1 TRINITY_DN2541_c0_g1~~TRINITY_DN2541_c0_g1_i1.p1  ORF type:complete len:253 (-),score=31.42 TRINITY_DN2541_c0_g1_i1:63-821(-)
MAYPGATWADGGGMVALSGGPAHSHQNGEAGAVVSAFPSPDKPVTEMLQEREEYRAALYDYTRRTIMSAHVRRMHDDERRQRFRDEHEYDVNVHVRTAEARKANKAATAAVRNDERFARLERNRRALQRQEQERALEKQRRQTVQRRAWEEQNAHAKQERHEMERRKAQIARENYLAARAEEERQARESRRRIEEHERRAAESIAEREARRRERNERRRQQDLDWERALRKTAAGTAHRTDRFRIQGPPGLG